MMFDILINIERRRRRRPGIINWIESKRENQEENNDIIITCMYVCTI